MSTTRRRKRHGAAPLLACAAAVAVLACATLWGLDAARGPPGVGGPFTLLDANGGAVTDRTFRGRFVLLYFGYTSCPDICPTTLATMAAALDQLGPAGARVQPVFITVDPARDTPSVLRAYAASIDPRLVALTGTEGEITDALRMFHVERSFHPGHGGAYLVDHTAVLYLLGPGGGFVAPIRADLPADRMAAAIAAHLPPPGANP